MSEQISKEQEYAEHILLVFFWNEEDDDTRDTTYDDFREIHQGTVSMVAQKHFGWTFGITPAGYVNVLNAFNDLKELGYLYESIDEDVETVLRTFHPETGSAD